MQSPFCFLSCFFKKINKNKAKKKTNNNFTRFRVWLMLYLSRSYTPFIYITPVKFNLEMTENNGDDALNVFDYLCSLIF